ncbi:MAG: hypothetical protein ACE5PV_00645 [Candidatus Poribacteria bacterium]
MYKITVTPIIACVLMGLLVAYAEAAKIEELAPANSLIYIIISDLDEIWDEGAASESWQAMFKSGETDGSLSEVEQAMEVMRFTIGTDARGIVETFGRQIAFVIMQPESGKREISMALILDTGGSRKEAEDIISKVSAVITMNSEKTSANPNAGKYKKISYGKVTLGKRIFRYGFIDDLLVIGLTGGGFKTVVDAYRKGTTSINHNSKFKDMRKRFANVQLFGYADIDNVLPILKANEQTLQPKALKFNLEPSTLQSVDAIGFGMDIFPVDGLQKLYIQMKGNKTSERRLSSSERAYRNQADGWHVNSIFREGKNLNSLLSLRSLGKPDTSDVFFAMSSDNLNDLWKSLFDNNDFHREIQKLEDMSGLDFETEILSSLTGEIVMSAKVSDEIPAGTSASISWKELVVFMGVKERGKWETTIDAIQKLTDTTARSEYNYKGATIRELSPPKNDLSRTFGYALTDKSFIAATSTDRVQSIIDGTATMKKSRMADSLFKGLPAPPSLFLRLNLDKLSPYMLNRAGVDLKAFRRIRNSFNVGACEYTVSPTSNGLWMCLRIISGKNLIDSLGEIAPVLAPLDIRNFNFR